MAESSKWHSKWWATGILLPVIASAIWDYAKEKPLLTTLMSWASLMYNILLVVLTFEVKVWQILVCIIGILCVLLLNAKLKSNTNKYKFLSYQSDTLKQWKWTWHIKMDYNRNLYDIRELYPNCSDCDMAMIDYSSYNAEGYICPKCEQKYINGRGYFEDKTFITAMISDKIKKIQTSN